MKKNMLRCGFCRSPSPRCSSSPRVPKLAGVPMMVQMFDALGFGQWFRYCHRRAGAWRRGPAARAGAGGHRRPRARDRHGRCDPRAHAGSRRQRGAGDRAARGDAHDRLVPARTGSLARAGLTDGQPLSRRPNGSAELPRLRGWATIAGSDLQQLAHRAVTEDARHRSTRGCRRSRRSRRAHAQPQEHRSDAADRQADHRDRRQRIGKVVARLRHDLRGRPAAVRRVAVGLRAAVSRADGEARRRSHRRHRAGHRHPPEEQHQESALDGRNDDRDPRLHAAAVRARRPDVLPELRPRGGTRDGRSRGPPARRIARGHPAAPRVRSPGRRDRLRWRFWTPDPRSTS